MRPEGLKKLYYSIREVSDLTGVEAHVLRFWEKEFPMLRPRRRSGNRAYRERDIQIVLAIKDLLYGQRFTIQGAVEQLRQDRSLWENRSLTDTPEASGTDLQVLTDLRKMLLDLKMLIEGTSRSK